MSLRRLGCASPLVTLVAVGLAATLVMPGALATYAVAGAMNATLDRGQAWTFAVAGSFAMYLAVIGASGGILRGSARFVLVGIASLMVLAVAAFGVHAHWPAGFARMFLGAQ